MVLPLTPMAAKSMGGQMINLCSTVVTQMGLARGAHTLSYHLISQLALVRWVQWLIQLKREASKYSHLNRTHIFNPVAVETTEVMGLKILSFMKYLGQRVKLTHRRGEVKVKPYPETVSSCAEEKNCIH